MKQFYVVFLLFSLIVVSCSKNDRQPTAQTKIKEVRSLQAFAGKNRIKIFWKLQEHENISKCRIWWNKRKDSLTVDIPDHTLSDSVIIDNLKEGTYTFFAALLDSKENVSDRVAVKGKVYGDKYTQGIENVTIQDINYDNAKATVAIQWNTARGDARGIELNYKDSTGILRDTIIPSYLSKAVLKKFNATHNNIICYRTLFVPELTAIDTFYTDYDTIRVAIGEILWDGNAANGTGIWKVINIEGTGSVSVVNDATYGQVWKFLKPAGSHRTEVHGVKGYQAREGDDIYIGWVSRLTMPRDLSTFAIFQWKSYPTAGSLQNHPVMLRTTNGNLKLRDYMVGDIPHDDWSIPLDMGAWHQFVLRIKVSGNRNTGFIEFWYDGVKQTLDNGTTRQYCRTLDSDYCDPKWGVYGGDAGNAVNLVGELKIASSYELAAPE